MMRCIAIDDEPMALKIISRYCDQVPFIHLLGTYTDPLEGISNIRYHQPDLLFLDIRMPDISGIDIAQELSSDALVIFSTAHREYAVEGFELNVVDYLLKPFAFERFLTACTKAEERYQASRKNSANPPPSPDETIMFRCNYQNIQLKLCDIMYVEAFDNYVKVVTANRTYMPVMTMKSMLNLLPEAGFVRVHKSFIVPVARIKSFNHEIVVTESIQLPVGRTFQKDFLDKMSGIKTQKQ